ncbi:unnamed protein product [Caenorhabditis sp. 36 PRJEB53466]|nr:unnamed protein product [Caenorhabditis sp. 36 PRJEB53466]
MSATFLILCLLCIGGSVRAGDGSEDIAQGYIRGMIFAIGTQNPDRISKRFAEDFVFTECKGEYNKNQVVALLRKVPKGSDFGIAFKDSHYLNQNADILFTVVVTGFGPVIEAEFTLQLNNRRYSLISGKRSNCCSCSRKLSVSVSDSANDIVKEFLNDLVGSLTAADEERLSSLFTEDFKFFGCKGTYYKEGVLAMLTKIPKGTDFNITLLVADFLNDNHDIVYHVNVSGFGDDITAFFFLLNIDGRYILSRGKIKNCVSRYYSEDGGALMIARAFTDALRSAVQSGDPARMGKLFSDLFVFNGCKGNYTKQQVLHMLSQATDLTFRPLNAHYLTNAADIDIHLELGVDIPQLSTSGDAFFVISNNGREYFLTNGRYSRCSADLVAAGDRSERIVGGFLLTLQKAIRSGSKTVIGSFFEDKYTFHGCKKDYSKEEVVNILSRISPIYPVNIVFKSSNFLAGGNDIEYHVTASGLGLSDAQFVLHISGDKHVLSSGKIEKCSEQKFNYLKK